MAQQDDPINLGRTAPVTESDTIQALLDEMRIQALQRLAKRDKAAGESAIPSVLEGEAGEGRLQPNLFNLAFNPLPKAGPPPTMRHVPTRAEQVAEEDWRNRQETWSSPKYTKDLAGLKQHIDDMIKDKMGVGAVNQYGDTSLLQDIGSAFSGENLYKGVTLSQKIAKGAAESALGLAEFPVQVIGTTLYSLGHLGKGGLSYSQAKNKAQEWGAHAAEWLHDQLLGRDTEGEGGARWIAKQPLELVFGGITHAIDFSAQQAMNATVGSYEAISGKKVSDVAREDIKAMYTTVVEAAMLFHMGRSMLKRHNLKKVYLGEKPMFGWNPQRAIDAKQLRAVHKLADRMAAGEKLDYHAELEKLGLDVRTAAENKANLKAAAERENAARYPEAYPQGAPRYKFKGLDKPETIQKGTKIITADKIITIEDAPAAPVAEGAVAAEGTAAAPVADVSKPPVKDRAGTPTAELGEKINEPAPAEGAAPIAEGLRAERARVAQLLKDGKITRQQHDRIQKKITETEKAEKALAKTLANVDAKAGKATAETAKAPEQTAPAAKAEAAPARPVVDAETWGPQEIKAPNVPGNITRQVANDWLKKIRAKGRDHLEALARLYLEVDPAGMTDMEIFAKVGPELMAIKADRLDFNRLEGHVRRSLFGEAPPGSSEVPPRGWGDQPVPKAEAAPAPPEATPAAAPAATGATPVPPEKTIAPPEKIISKHESAGNEIVIKKNPNAGKPVPEEPSAIAVNFGANRQMVKRGKYDGKARASHTKKKQGPFLVEIRRNGKVFKAYAFDKLGHAKKYAEFVAEVAPIPEGSGNMASAASVAVRSSEAFHEPGEIRVRPERVRDIWNANRWDKDGVQFDGRLSNGRPITGFTRGFFRTKQELFEFLGKHEAAHLMKEFSRDRFKTSADLEEAINRWIKEGNGNPPGWEKYAEEMARADAVLEESLRGTGKSADELMGEADIAAPGWGEQPVPTSPAPSAPAATGITKVISGGQAGVDQAALEIAKAVGLETGGTMPKGFVTLEGNRPDMAQKFGMKEHPTAKDYPTRTEKNIVDSDGTVVFGETTGRGTSLTIRLVKKHNKPLLVNPKSAAELSDWAAKNNIKTLNVAGPRSIAAETRTLMEDVLGKKRAETPPRPPVTEPAKASERPATPKTEPTPTPTKGPAPEAPKTPEIVKAPADAADALKRRRGKGTGTENMSVARGSSGGLTMDEMARQLDVIEKDYRSGKISESEYRNTSTELQRKIETLSGEGVEDFPAVRRPRKTVNEDMTSELQDVNSMVNDLRTQVEDFIATHGERFPGKKNVYRRRYGEKDAQGKQVKDEEGFNVTHPIRGEKGLVARKRPVYSQLIAGAEEYMPEAVKAEFIKLKENLERAERISRRMEIQEFGKPLKEDLGAEPRRGSLEDQYDRLAKERDRLDRQYDKRVIDRQEYEEQIKAIEESKENLGQTSSVFLPGGDQLPRRPMPPRPEPKPDYEVPRETKLDPFKPERAPDFSRFDEPTIDAAGRFIQKIDKYGTEGLHDIKGAEIDAISEVMGDRAQGIIDIMANQNEAGRFGKFEGAEGTRFATEFNKLKEAFQEGYDSKYGLTREPAQLERGPSQRVYDEKTQTYRWERRSPVEQGHSEPTQFSSQKKELGAQAKYDKETAHRAAREEAAKANEAPFKIMTNEVVAAVEPILRGKALGTLRGSGIGMAGDMAELAYDSFKSDMYKTIERRMQEKTWPDTSEIDAINARYRNKQMNQAEYEAELNSTEWVDKAKGWIEKARQRMAGETGDRQWAWVSSAERRAAARSSAPTTAAERAARGMGPEREYAEESMAAPERRQAIDNPLMEYHKRKMGVLGSATQEAIAKALKDMADDWIASEADKTVVRRAERLPGESRLEATERQRTEWGEKKRKVIEMMPDDLTEGVIAQEVGVSKQNVNNFIRRYKEYMVEHAPELARRIESEIRKNFKDLTPEEQAIQTKLEMEGRAPMTPERAYNEHMKWLDEFIKETESMSPAERDALVKARRAGKKPQPEPPPDWGEQRPGEGASELPPDMPPLPDPGVEDFPSLRKAKEAVRETLREWGETPRETAARERAGMNLPRAMNPETQARIEASAGAHHRTVGQRVHQFLKERNYSINKMFGALDKKTSWHAPIINALQKMANETNRSFEWANHIVNGEQLKVFEAAFPSRKEKLFLHKVFSEYIWSRDVHHMAVSGLYEKVPFFERDLQGAVKYFQDMEARIEGIRDTSHRALVKQVIKARDAEFNRIREAIETEAKIAGYPSFANIFKNLDYYRHEVVKFYDDYKLGKGTSKKLAPTRGSWSMKRTGYGGDIELDVPFIDTEILSRLHFEAERLKLYNFIDKNYNYFEDLMRQATAKGWTKAEMLANLPEDFVKWTPDKRNLVYGAKTLPESIAQQISSGRLAELAEEKGMGQMWEYLKGNIDDAMAIGAKRNPWVLHRDIAGALDDFSRARPEGKWEFLGKVATPPIQLWKKWRLHSPYRLIKFTLRNLTGDAEAVAIGNPSAFKQLWGEHGAIKNMSKYMDGKPTDQWFKDWMDQYGFGGSFHRMEFSQVARLHGLSKMFPDAPTIVGAPLDAMKKAWNGWFEKAGKFSDVREGLLRGAAYKDYLDQIHRNIRAKGEMRPDNYGASTREFIQGLDNPSDMAYNLSNDLLGDYAGTSPIGQKLSQGTIPFWRWKEITMKRYYHMARNAWIDGKTAGEIGRMFIKGSPGAAARFGAFVVKANMYMAGLSALNHLIFPEGESNLPVDVKQSPHITLGGGHYFPQVGMGADAFDFMGIETPPELVWHLLSGETDFQKIADRWWNEKPWINHIFQSINPFAKLTGELLFGKKLYPSISNPRGIRDPYEHVANAFDLGDGYRLLFNRPGRSIGKMAFGAIGYQHDEYETAYFDWIKRVNEYKKSHGSQTVGYSITPKSNHLYYFKRFRTEGDAEGARREFKKYLVAAFQEGGLRGLPADEVGKRLVQSIKQSYNVMNPIYHLNEHEMKDLGDQLTEREKRMLVMAFGHWANVIVGSDDAAKLLFENEEKKED